jgi:hypothetical protein
MSSPEKLDSLFSFRLGRIAHAWLRAMCVIRDRYELGVKQQSSAEQCWTDAGPISTTEHSDAW